MKTASWVIVGRKDGQPRHETFKEKTAAFYREEYPHLFEVLPILEWLQRLNREARPK